MTFNFGQLPGYKPSSDEIVIENTVIGTACTTPTGLIHAEIESEHASESIIRRVIEKWNPTTCAINYPTREQFAHFQEQGFYLRSEIVRWFAPIESTNDPWMYLKPKRAKKIKSHVRKARSYVDITREPLTIENFKRWLPIYEKEVVDRPGGTRIFYCDLFLAGRKMTDLEMISCFRKSDGIYVGGSIVNPWGSFGDIEGDEKWYTSFLMSALDTSTRPYAVGYLLDEIVMDIARQNGCKVYGHGGDMNFWGTDMLPGLLSRKSACGMLPVPDGKIQAFRIVDDRKALNLHRSCFLFEITGTDLTDQYFNQRSNGWHDSANNLYKPVWGNPKLLREISNQMTVHHFGSENCKIQLPEDLKLIEHMEIS